MFRYLWLAWAVLFGVIEGTALFNKTKDDTLSENLRDLFHTNTRTGRTVWGVVFGIFAGLFALHISGSKQTWW